MAQRSIRFPEDVEEAIFSEVERTGRSLAWVVIQCVRYVLVHLRTSGVVVELDSHVSSRPGPPGLDTGGAS